MITKFRSILYGILLLFLILTIDMISGSGALCLFLLSGFSLFCNVEALNFSGNFICTDFHPSGWWSVGCDRLAIIIGQRPCLPYSDGSIFRSRGICFPYWCKAQAVHRTVVTLVTRCIQSTILADMKPDMYQPMTHFYILQQSGRTIKETGVKLGACRV